jgi:hypothetical protein
MAITTKRWTLEELHALPDGNRYELIHEELRSSSSEPAESLPKSVSA